MIEARGTERAVRITIIAWPAADLPALIDANDAVVCWARSSGGREAHDALVKTILARALADAPGADVARSPAGKPYLTASGPRQPLNFNVSHSGDVILVALSRAADVGVDVERVRLVPEWRAIAKRMFDAATRDQLLTENTRGSDEADAFIRLWCRHEASVKATGEGLFPSDIRDDARGCNADHAQLRVIDLPELPLPAGAGRYRGALALLQ